ncbi:MAG: MFS transporter [Firmicutes bacterium HGW-Firmicutes-16]|nr:MAG: MFS transporter [Firmicutes bacterium HGW-Firmicutes-16]
MSNTFSAFRHKSFLYYFIGMCISTTGSWMQNIAQPWLAYRLTDSALLLGLVSAMQFLPVLLFSLFAGVLVDRFPKKKLLIITQTASLVITGALAILVYSGNIQYWHLLVTSTLLGFVNTLDMPVRQSFLIELVGKEDLMNGIALNSAMFNLSRTIGPALAGIVMGNFGIAACFLINSISFAAVLVSLFFIKPLIVQKPVIRDVSIFKDISDGLKYIYHKKILFVTILIMAVVGTFAMNFNVLVPVFAVQVLHQSETGYGLLMSCMGIGSFFGAMLIAAISKSGPKKFIMFVIPIFAAISLTLTGFTSVYALTGIALGVTGFFFIMFASNANSTMQMNTESKYLGRVMSVYTLVFAGSTPLGNLYAGGITEKFGARIGVIACGGIILVLMIPIYIYLRRGKEKLSDDKA